MRRRRESTNQRDPCAARCRDAEGEIHPAASDSPAAATGTCSAARDRQTARSAAPPSSVRRTTGNTRTHDTAADTRRARHRTALPRATHPHRPRSSRHQPRRPSPTRCRRSIASAGARARRGWVARTLVYSARCALGATRPSTANTTMPGAMPRHRLVKCDGSVVCVGTPRTDLVYRDTRRVLQPPPVLFTRRPNVHGASVSTPIIPCS